MRTKSLADVFFFCAAFSFLVAATGSTTASAATVPRGFSISVFAHVPAAREMAVCGSKLYVGSKGSSAYVVPISGGVARRIPKSLTASNGVACGGGRLFVAGRDQIVSFSLDASGAIAGGASIVRSGLPNSGVHDLRYTAVGGDGRLYVSFGSPCNVCEPHGLAGTIVSMDANGAGLSRVAWGVRNSVGFDWANGGALYFTDNGADMMGDNIPPDLLYEARDNGAFYGFPYVQGNTRLTGFQTAALPATPVPPAFEFPAHVASLGIHFYRGAAFPGFTGDAFVAEHGSWNRSVPDGRQVVVVKFAAGRAVGQSVFATGVGRPVDVKELPDGSLLISSDATSTIYRVTYGR